MDDTRDPFRRFFDNQDEAGKQVALICAHGEEMRQRWSSWEKIDKKKC